MNTFNRIVVIVWLLVLAALAVALLLTPYEALSISITSLEALREFLLFADGQYIWYVATLTVFLILLLVLLYLEIRRTRKKSVLIRTESGGRARIGLDSVMHSLENRISELQGIHDVRPQVVSGGRDVRVTVHLRTSPTVNVPTVIQQIVDLTHEIIEGQLGVRIHGKVEVNVAHEPLPRGTLAPGAARAQWGEPVPPARREEPQPVRPRPVPVETHPERARTQVEAPPERPPVTGWVEPALESEAVPSAPAPLPEEEFDLKPQDLGQETEPAPEEPENG